MTTATDSDPVTIADALAAVPSFTPSPRDDFIAFWNADHVRDPDSTAKIGVCRHCGAILGDSPSDMVVTIGHGLFLPNVCCKACSEAAQEKWRLDEIAAQSARFAGIIPPAFAEWDDALGNTRALQRVTSRFSFSNRKGLVLHGPSGGCKTRIFWHLVRRIAEENEKQERQMTWLFCDSFDFATKGIPADAAWVDFLFIDDLGNEPSGSKFESALLQLIRKRCDWHRPIFVSTQLTPQLFKAKFFNGSAGEAIMRRFRERVDSVDCSQ